MLNTKVQSFHLSITQYHWTNGPQEIGLTDTSDVQIYFQDANLRQYDAATTAGRNRNSFL